MCAEKTGQQEIEVYMSRRFEKVFESYPDQQQEEIDNQIDLIIDNPEIGERKKGDLDFLRVHKFRMNNQQYLLSYSWVEKEIKIFLLSLGSHENFYDDQKRHRKADLRLIRS
ncbi:type II toxin-antitoxin system RelE/ParE family toxin [Citrobacter werkmanii]|uniref:type II toxin-antitoxin system RelE/ParE family toxin n=1 Tax=Citrobacter werkmanii TaxID=67827 RepID=UPI0037CC17B3